MEYRPWRGFKPWELGEGLEAAFLQHDLFHGNPISKGFIKHVEKWPLEKFNKIMSGFFQAYGGDRDEY